MQHHGPESSGKVTVSLQPLLCYIHTCVRLWAFFCSRHILGMLHVSSRISGGSTAYLRPTAALDRPGQAKRFSACASSALTVSGVSSSYHRSWQLTARGTPGVPQVLFPKLCLASSQAKTFGKLGCWKISKKHHIVKRPGREFQSVSPAAFVLRRCLPATEPCCGWSGRRQLSCSVPARGIVSPNIGWNDSNSTAEGLLS